MARVELSRADLMTLVDSLALSASRRESQARSVKHGRHHDVAAAKMRALRLKLMKTYVATFGGKT